MAEPQLQTYNGSCHCKAFQYTVKLPPVKKASTCNCSICSKKGYLWTFPPSDDAFVVEKGEDALKSYEFANKTMTHKFCPTCGTPALGQRHGAHPHSIGVNVRTLEGVDIDELELGSFDGASLPPAFERPKPAESEGKYHGSCHCGKVTFSLESPPLKDLTLTDCNCSICSRNAYLWLYPLKPSVTIRGLDHLTVYRFNSKQGGHAFCSTCGVPTVNLIHGPEGKVKMQPVNMRTLDGVDLAECKKIDLIDGRRVGGGPIKKERIDPHEQWMKIVKLMGE